MKKIRSYGIAFICYAILFWFILSKSVGGDWDFSAFWDYRKVILGGFLTTILISTAALMLSLLVGLGLYFMMVSRFTFLNALAAIHKNIIFGTPLVVIAIVSYYYIGYAFGFNNKFWVGVFTLALYIGAYISDIYKAAVDAIHPNQWQTAQMFGFTRWQMYRYVVLPQILSIILPPLAGQFALTIKGSALLSYMATDEFLNAIKTVQAATFRYSEGFVIVTIGYLLITVPLIQLIRWLETRSQLPGGPHGFAD